MAPVVVDAVLDADEQTAGLDDRELRTLAGARRGRGGGQEPSEDAPSEGDSEGSGVSEGV